MNPVSAGLANKPEKWQYSSYSEYVSPDESLNRICNFDDLFELSPTQYRKFVNDGKNYQKQMSLIKNLVIDDYTG